METYAQRSIRHCIDMIAPFELSDYQEENGQLQFYQFMHSLYREMYQRPEEYMVFPEPYEVYMAKLKKQGVQPKKEKEHVTNARESTLRNTFQMNRIHESQYNAGRYEVLVKGGIRVSEIGGIVYIVHEEYPRMMEGIAYLCKAPDSKYKWMNFLRLDFKNAYAPIPTVNDICKTLSARSSEAVRKLENNLAGMSVKVRIKPRQAPV